MKTPKDAAGREIRVGQQVAYAISLGRCAGVQCATVHNITDKGKVQLKIDKHLRQSWGTKDVVTVQYPERMAILEGY